MPTMTPNEVAARSGISRRTVMRAITKGLLVAKRTNDGWSIEESDFEVWAHAHAQPTEQRMRTEEPAQPPLPTPPIDTINTDILIQSLRDLVDAERRRADAAESDRDAWREMAQRSWWKKLVG